MELQRERSKFVCPLNVIDLLFPCFKYNSTVYFNFISHILSMELQRERSKFVCPLNVIDLLFPCFKYNSSVHFNFSVDTLSIRTVTGNIEICCLSFKCD